MKVYMDIITNHTVDVIQYRECPASPCAYRSRADYPYRRRGSIGGKAINQGFTGDQDHGEANFARLTDPSYAYTPYVPRAEKKMKVPAWLNDPLHYHNRGETTFSGESSTMGDFVRLDDLMTEDPVGDGGDQDAREDMFGSRVASYNDNRLLGTAATTATPRFDTGHPLYRQIAGVARLRVAQPALRRGRQLIRACGDRPGLFAVSRFDPDSGPEPLIAFNTSTAPVTAQVEVDSRSSHFTTLAGAPCAASASAPGSLAVSLPPLSYSICAARSASSQ